MSNSYRPPPAAARWTRRLLLAVWAGMTLAALGFVLYFGRNAPWADEWEMIPGLVSAEPLLPWLWRQHNEHRLPLPRLLVWLTFQATHDFRAGMVVQIGLLSAAALGLMWLAASIRGRPHVADAFFPLGLLHWGHVENLVMGYQVCFALTACGVLGLLGVAAKTTPPNRVQSGIAAGVILVLLELTGGSGLPFVPAVGAWLLWLAWAEWRDGQRRGAAAIALLVLVAVGYVGVYLIGYARPAAHPPPNVSDWERVSRVFAQFLGMAIGPADMTAWPTTAAVVLAVLAATAYRLTVFALRVPPIRPCYLGLLAVLGGVVLLAAAVAVGRSGFRNPDMGLWSRYAVLAWPALAVTYISMLTARPPAAWAATVGLFVMAVVALPANTLYGLSWAAGYAAEMDRMEADVRAGLPPPEVIRRGRYLTEIERDGQIVAGMRLLRAADVSYFREANAP